MGLENLDYENNHNKNEATWIDFDNDGDLDVHFHRPGTSSFTPGRLMRNDLDINGGFTDVTGEVGLEPQGNLFQSSWIDYNNDGYLDVYIGHRGGDGDSLGSRLFRNDLATTGRFVDVSLEVGLDSIVSSTAWADIDHDGDLDFLATSNEGTIYYNDNGIFTPDKQAWLMIGRSTGWADIDNDGDLDFFGGGPIDQHKLLRNNQDDSNYLKIRLLDLNGGLNRQGSQIRVYLAGTDSLVGMRMVAVETRGSADMYDVHFGLDGNMAYDIAVHLMRKTNGKQVILTKQTFPHLGNVVPTAIGGFLEIRDIVGGNTTIGITGSTQRIPLEYALLPAYPNPFNASTTLRIALLQSSPVTLAIYDLGGHEIFTLVDADLTAGYHSFIWDGRDFTGKPVPSGMYITKMVTPSFTQFIKMILLK